MKKNNIKYCTHILEITEGEGKKWKRFDKVKTDIVPRIKERYEGSH